MLGNILGVCQPPRYFVGFDIMASWLEFACSVLFRRVDFDLNGPVDVELTMFFFGNGSSSIGSLEYSTKPLNVFEKLVAEFGSCTNGQFHMKQP